MFRLAFPTSGGTLGTPEPNQSNPRTFTLDPWLIAALIVGLVVRVQAAMRSHLWFDEIYTLWVARRPFRELIATVAADVHPPLHYLMVSAWRALGGENDVYLKTLSILAGLATIYITFAIGRELFSRTTGAGAAFLLALHPAHVAFSQESRSYATLFMLLAASQWCAWCWVERGGKRYGFGFVLAAAAALYTHYLAAPVLACTALWGLWALMDRDEATRIRPWIGLHLLVALLFAPQLPTVWTQAARLRHDRWVQSPLLDNFTNLLRLLAYSRTAAILPLLGLAALPVLRRGARPAGVLLWMASLVPATLLFVLANRGTGVFVERYMLFGLPAWCVLLAAGAAGLRWAWLRAASIALLLLVAARGLFLHEPQVEAARLTRLESYLAAHVRSGDVVVHADAHSLLFARHYGLDPGVHLIYLRTPGLPYYEGNLVIPDAWRIGPHELEALRSSGRRWWAVDTRYGFVRADAETTDLALAAGARVWTIDRATVWGGQGAGADSAAH